MRSCVDVLHGIIGDGQSAWLLTVAHIRGSAPREAGARMVVSRDKTFGTIGGGQLEYECTRIAARRLRSGEPSSPNSFVRTFPLGSSCGQCCGGIVDVLFEPVSAADAGWLADLKQWFDRQRDFVAVAGGLGGRAVIDAETAANFGLSPPNFKAATAQARAMLAGAVDVAWDSGSDTQLFYERVAASDFNVAVFGAGHVGSATVAALAPLDVRIRWVDSRRGVFPAAVPDNVLCIESDAPAREVSAMPGGSYYLVMTHSHALDYDICSQVLLRRDARYCGLIGSLSKRRRFERLMRKQGVSERITENLVCPIGVGGISGKKPQEIAIAAAAELLQIRDAAATAAGSRLADNIHVI